VLMYAAHLWQPNAKWFRSAQSILVKPLRSALWLPASTHHLSILTEFGIPTPEPAASTTVFINGM